MTHQVAVVGATGHIGRPLCGALMRTGYPVVVFSREPARARRVVPGAGGVHAAFGLALVLASFAAVALTWRQGGRVAVALSVLGGLAIVGAAFNGVSFLNYGYAFSSMIMSGLWALALACYLVGAVLAGAALAVRPAGRRISSDA